ncbi:hypothetical protein D3C86_2202580 [compost metagenome]
MPITVSKFAQMVFMLHKAALALKVLSARPVLLAQLALKALLARTVQMEHR